MQITTITERKMEDPAWQIVIHTKIGYLYPNYVSTVRWNSQGLRVMSGYHLLQFWVHLKATGL